MGVRGGGVFEYAGSGSGSESESESESDSGSGDDSGEGDCSSSSDDSVNGDGSGAGVNLGEGGKSVESSEFSEGNSGREERLKLEWWCLSFVPVSNEGTLNGLSGPYVLINLDSPSASSSHI